eukprot:5583940-Alexandrium_andersonii.AAC.1
MSAPADGARAEGLEKRGQFRVGVAGAASPPDLVVAGAEEIRFAQFARAWGVPALSPRVGLARARPVLANAG